MKLSLNHIRFYRNEYSWSPDPAPHGVDELVEKIGAQLGAVEEVSAYGARFDGVLVAKVVACESHPNADRLHVCKLDDGGRAQDVERDSDGYVQVVCGAPNVRSGLLVAWLPPGTTVPESYDKEPFVLEARPLRGVVSNGMLASPRELSLGDSHDGILEIDDTAIAPGTSFAEAFDISGDVIIDIENKMFTHRPDCFGMMGVAREIAGIYQQAFTSPEWYRHDVALEGAPATASLPLTVRNELPDLVKRFIAVPLQGVTVKPSPVWLQVSLSRLGIRPINNIVDLTNYYMILTGQPLHAYDYDKVRAQDQAAQEATLVVRKPAAQERLRLLNGKEIEPRADAIMIATRDRLIGVGGVMGGADTEVDANTKNIIIECATFDMYSVRRTSMAHGLFTDAVSRFNKGQSPLQNRAVIARVVKDAQRLAGGELAGDYIDDVHLPQDVLERGSLHTPITVTADFINQRLGLMLSVEDMAQLLTNVECKVQITDASLTVMAPFWRTDLEIPEDIVEEVGRLYGFDHLPLELPKRDITPATKDPALELKTVIRDQLSRSGANEVLTYSFVHGNLLQKVGQDPAQAFQLSNALSPDLQYFRLDIMPSLLDKISPNLKAGYDEFALFEIGKNHTLLHPKDADGLPSEFDMAALVYTASDKLAKQGAAFYQARVFLTCLADRLHLQLKFTPITDSPDVPVVQPYDLSRSAYVSVEGSDQFLGIIGEFKPSVRKNLKLPVQTAGFEIGIKELLAAARNLDTYLALPRFPKVEQDICLRVPVTTAYQTVYDFVWEALAEVQPANTLPSLGPVDIYQRDSDAGHKQITLRFSLASYERTLVDAEVTKMLDHVAAAAADKLQAERI